MFRIFRKLKRRSIVFTADDFFANKSLKEGKRDLKYYINKFKNNLKLTNLFGIEDEDIKPKRGIEIALILHLIIFIVIIFPWYIFAKPKKMEKRVAVTVMRKAGGNNTGENAPVVAENPNNNEQNKQDNSLTKNNKEEKVVKKDVKEKPVAKEKDGNNVSKIIDNLKSFANGKSNDVINNNQVEKASQKNKNDDKSSKKDVPEKSEKQKKDAVKNDSGSNAKASDGSDGGVGKDSRFTDVADIDGISTEKEVSGIANDKNTIAAQLHACWTQTQLKSKMPKDIFVSVLINFSPNGQISSYNIREKQYLNASQNIAYNVAKDNVKIALENCKNIKGLRSENYQQWRQISVNFKYSEIEI
ncbi:hypothetical protein [Candidatus Deianiraea vastatrix]|uniref:Uncharacterized protein n=1 Tax=Candidatus Deianiraea vastatrix TaxID=2163644 RepID=A0A5B8XDX2_9RICK|nr:hypothetical protein [Candidatus Deianiraea vastatrix]QED23508.1 hypothetical protein Deia_00717 [Candidatus Deianiraea vastatrix]